MIDEIIFIFTHPEIIKGLFEFIVSQWLPALMLLIAACAFGFWLGWRIRRTKR